MLNAFDKLIPSFHKDSEDRGLMKLGAIKVSQVLQPKEEGSFDDVVEPQLSMFLYSFICKLLNFSWFCEDCCCMYICLFFRQRRMNMIPLVRSLWTFLFQFK